MNTPQNNGHKVFTLLVEYSSLTGQPTGRQKPNVPEDPNYIAPIVDLISCPLGGANTAPIIVEIDSEYTADIKLLYGLAEFTTSVPGVWTVPLKIYDSIVFKINTGTHLPKCRVTYNNNGTVYSITLLSVTGQILIPGPFANITKLEIISSVIGDFSNDFNNDFNNNG